MKRIAITWLLSAGMTGQVIAQKASVETISLSLKTYGKANERVEIRKHSLEEAKRHADLAFANPSTSNDPKMWLMRARTYLAIQTDTLGEGRKPVISDPNAIEVAVTSIVNCHKTDKEQKFIKTEEAVVALVHIAVQARFIADVAYNQKDYARSIQYYGLTRDLIPYDTENQLKRQNISGERLLFNMATTEKLAGQFDIARQHFNELIKMNYNDAWVYLELYDLYLNQDHDTAMAIQTIDAGRKMFEDNMNMKRQQIFIYSAAGKSDDLIRIMDENIAQDPYNGSNYYLRGILHQQEGKMDKAEADLLKAVEYNDEMLEAHEDLGILYYEMGVDISEEANNLGFNETEKYQKMNEQVSAYFMKSIPHFEKIYELTSDDKMRNKSAQVLLAMYLKTEQTEKYNKLKAELGK